MKKIDGTVVRETKYIAACTLALSALMQAVFLVLGRWDATVLPGNILGAVAAVGNFLLMGITVQKAVQKEEKEARSLVKLSQSLRQLMLLAVAMVGYFVPVFHTVAVVLPFLFPRIAVALYPVLRKEKA